MTSLKRGSYSGSNGGICGFFEKVRIWLLLKVVRALNHLQEVQHTPMDVLKPRSVLPLKSIVEPLNS